MINQGIHDEPSAMEDAAAAILKQPQFNGPNKFSQIEAVKKKQQKEFLKNIYKNVDNKMEKDLLVASSEQSMNIINKIMIKDPEKGKALKGKLQQVMEATIDEYPEIDKDLAFLEKKRLFAPDAPKEVFTKKELEKASVGKVHERDAARGATKFTQIAEKEKEEERKFMRNMYKNIETKLEDEFVRENHTFANAVTVIDTRVKKT